MVRRYIFAADAQRDVATITDFLISENPRAAEAVVTRMEKAVQALCEHPYMGPLAPETGRPAIRRLSIPPYILYYRVQDEIIQVVRVLHTRLARSTTSSSEEAMTRTIDYYLIASSPYAYLGHQAFHEIAAKHGAEIRTRPVDIMGVWASSGSVPLGQRTPLRQRYRRVELQRIAEMRGLKLNLEPKFFPVDSALADRTVIALVEAGADPSGFLWRVHQGVWANEENIGDRAQLAAYLTAEGHDAEAVLGVGESEKAEAIRKANTADAVAVDAVGAPVYVLDGEAFWGQDRLEHLDHMLTTGRAAFKP